MEDTKTDAAAVEVDAEIIEDATEPTDLAPTPQAGALAPITFDFEAAKQLVRSQCEMFKGLTVDVSDKQAIKGAKKCRAQVNAWSKALTQAAAKAKEPYKAEIDKLNAQVNELKALYAETVQEIDVYINAYTEAEQEKKLADLREYWETFAGELAQVVSFETAYSLNPKWKNATYSAKTAKADIEQLIKRIIRERQAIVGMQLSHANAADLEYCKTLDLARAVETSKELERKEQEEAEHAQKAQELEELRAQNLGETATEPQEHAEGPVPVYLYEHEAAAVDPQAPIQETPAPPVLLAQPMAVTAKCETLNQYQGLMAFLERGSYEHYERPAMR